MPYYVHSEDFTFCHHETEDDSIYPAVRFTHYGPSPYAREAGHILSTGDYYEAQTAKTAHEAKTAHRSLVTFHATSYERENWRCRERRRTTHGSPRAKYVPWRHEPWYYEALTKGEPSLAYQHCAYLSVEAPGMVAYTPSEEYGVTDRQLRVRPGKYLERFAPHLTQAERDAWCAQVKALQDADIVLFAEDADMIEEVYTHGPNSCMSHGADSFASPFHPVRVYGESDFDIAYLKDEDDRIRARAIVWRARKLVGRCYGDTTLIYLLKKDGYTQVDTMLGATITAVVHAASGSGSRRRPTVFVAPYMDVCNSFYYDDARKVLVTSDCGIDADIDSGYFDAKATTGLTDNRDREDDTHECANCGDGGVAEDETYCESCDNSHYCCSQCDGEFFDDDNQYIANFGTVCQSCYDELVTTCETCGDAFHERAFGRTEQRRRAAEGLTDYCDCCAAKEEDRRNAETEAENTDTVDGIDESADTSEKSPF